MHFWAHKGLPGSFGVLLVGGYGLVVADTQSDSIQYLVQYCFTQDSIQNIIQLKKINSKVSKKTKKGAFHKKWQI